MDGDLHLRFEEKTLELYRRLDINFEQNLDIEELSKAYNESIALLKQESMETTVYINR